MDLQPDYTSLDSGCRTHPCRRVRPRFIGIAPGNSAYAEQDYTTAVEKYRESAAADPDLAAPLHNTAGALYRQEAYDQVPAALQVAMRNVDETLTQQSHHNLGNSLFKAED
jgi:tetratricopeptide (TPR) repeat protein